MNVTNPKKHNAQLLDRGFLLTSMNYGEIIDRGGSQIGSCLVLKKSKNRNKFNFRFHKSHCHIVSVNEIHASMSRASVKRAKKHQENVKIS